MVQQAANKSLNHLSSDKFGFGVFVAAAAHGVIIFGLTFNWSTLSTPSPEIEVTIVSHSTEAEPEDADFLAQANQEASGTEDQALAITTDQVSAFVGEDSGQFNPYDTTSGTLNPTTQSALSGESSEIATEISEQNGNAPSDSQSSAEASALLARLDALKQELAKRPRVGTLTSVAARSREDAAYQVMLQERIVAIGNSNFPERALAEGIFGSLRLHLNILPSGRIESIDITQSSGHAFLDQAAVEIARKAGPFEPFSTELSAKYDIITFIRTYQFLPNSQIQLQ